MKLTMADLVDLGAIDDGLCSFLSAAVRARQQLIVAGATGAGKTTMLRALAAEIPSSERIVTIETELELGLDRFADVHPDCVHSKHVKPTSKAPAKSQQRSSCA